MSVSYTHLDVYKRQAKLLADKKTAYAEYRQTCAAMRELLTVKNNVDRVLGFEAGKQIEKERDQKQNR